jgi:hypothetical protein
MSRVDNYRDRLDPHGRSRFEIIVMYSLVGMVLCAVGIMLKPTGPILEGPLIMWETTEPACKEKNVLAEGWGTGTVFKCEQGAVGALRKVEGVVWWECRCPLLHDLECVVEPYPALSFGESSE